MWRKRKGLTRVLLAAGVAFGACTEPADEPTAPTLSLTASVVLVGAGDVASCESNQGDEKTAALLANIPGTVFTAGDNVYDDGTAGQYSQCYGPSWGAFRSRTRPALGNHEYNTGSAGASFDYFGSRIGERGKGYYSYSLGAWHIVVLNSNWRYVSTEATSAQVSWLKADLAATTKRCVLAYWHQPRFYSSGDAAPAPYAPVKPFWDALYAAGAEVIINGHQHFYERYAPQTPFGSPDKALGIRQFIVGTGGKSTGPTPAVRQRNSEVAHGGDREFGVLKLTLGDDTYAWKFIPVAGKSWTDSGSGTCH